MASPARVSPERKFKSVSHSNISADRITGAVSTVSSGYVGSVEVENRVWSSIRTEGYQAKRRRKQRLPVNPYILVKWKLVADTGYSERNINPAVISTVTYSSSAYVWESSRRSFDGTANGEADAKAIGKLASRMSFQGFNAAVAFAERRQTASLLADTAFRIATAARWVKRGDLVHAYRALGVSSSPTKAQMRSLTKTPADKRLANHWLELQFGWSPLLSDARNAAELLANHISGDAYHTQVSATATAKATHKFGGSLQGRTDTIEESCRVKYVVRYRLDNEARLVLSQTGITNPLSVLWEVVPYSFVVDWFLPVGNYLQALRAFDGFELTGGHQSVIYSYIDAYDLRYRSQSSPGYSFQRDAYCAWHTARYTRIPLTSFPSVALPSFRNPIGDTPVWKFLTSMALMRQVFGRNSPTGGILRT